MKKNTIKEILGNLFFSLPFLLLFIVFPYSVGYYAAYGTIIQNKVLLWGLGVMIILGFSPFLAMSYYLGIKVFQKLKEFYS